MVSFSEILECLAVLSLALAGACWIVGWKKPRDALLRAALALAVLSAFLPGVFTALAEKLRALRRPRGVGLTLGILMPVLVGHAALAVTLLRRRLRDRRGAPSEAAQIEAARARERPRLPADASEPEPAETPEPTEPHDDENADHRA